MYNSCSIFSDQLNNYPAPLSQNNRILGMVLSYNFGHIDPIMLIISEYQSMCEGGWNPTVVFFTTVQWSKQMSRYMRKKTFCYRINGPINLVLSVHDPSIGIALGAEHRKYMGTVLNNFDVFIYHEDDIVFKHAHLNAYLHETKLLHTIMPDKGLRDHTIGFQRYRKLYRGGNLQDKYTDTDVFEQELFEEVPSFSPACIANEPYLVVGGNTHQAMWIFTKIQVDILQEKCSFLNQSSASRFYNNYYLYHYYYNYYYLCYHMIIITIIILLFFAYLFFYYYYKN
jgi:hypothetical protein